MFARRPPLRRRSARFAAESPGARRERKVQSRTHRLQHRAVVPRAGIFLHSEERKAAGAGATSCGVNFGDDSRCVDYLLSRKEVDKDRIGVTGLSGGGWRTNILAALDDRIQAAVPLGWMTTGDHQQPYNVAGAIGTFCLLPGVWDRIDIPDLMAMAAPKACMVVSGKQDIL